VVIAIDGPSGVGKSTVSRSVATAVGFAYLDTGATYRAATLAVLDAGVDVTDETAVLAELEQHSIDYDERGILLDGESVAFNVRSDAVTANVSVVSAHPLVRSEIVEIQRRWVGHHDGDAVVEGRDIGTVVFPDAPTKVFLTASPEVRARRRAGDSEAGGRSVADIAAALAFRDEADSTRKTSPLRPADDAVIIDTGDLTIGQVVQAVVELIR
jgi:cytidylate kinase